MAKILVPKENIESLIKLDEKGLDKLALFGTPVENITNSEIELEISANRPDLLSTKGLIRSLSLYLGKNIKQYSIKKSSSNVIVDKSVKVSRPYTRCAIIKDLKLNDSLMKQIVLLQEKLHNSIGRNRKQLAIGIYPLEKIKFPITYTAKAPKEISFQPLGSSKQMNATQILEKHPAGKEYGHLLSKESKYPIFIDANKSILSMPPIINSEQTGRVTTSTKELFVECSGSNPYLLEKTINIIVTALADMGGTIHETIIEDGKKESSPKLEWEKMKLNPDYLEKVLGIKLKEHEIQQCLEKMGHIYKNKLVLVAPWRTDILHQIDLVEDIMIAYGYDKIPSMLPKISTIAHEDELESFKKTLNELLIGQSASQIMTPHLITAEEAKKMKILHTISVESSKSEFTILRPNLLIPMLRTLAHNTDTEYPQKLFELGKIFTRDGSEECGIKEEEFLCLAITPGNVTEAKQLAEYIIRMLNLSCSFKERKEEGFIDGRVASLLIDNNEIGYIGEMHPNTLNDWRLKMPLSIVTINLNSLYNQLYPK